MHADVTHDRPRILVAVRASDAADFFPDRSYADLARLGELSFCEPDELSDSALFAEKLRDVVIVVSGWGFPQLDAARLADAPHLTLVAHAASSLRSIVTEDFWRSGRSITQAGAAMSPAVAELSLVFTLSLLRRVPAFDHALRAGEDWETARLSRVRREIAGARITVVGASRTGRAYIQAVQALGASVRVADPYVKDNDPLSEVTGDLHALLPSTDVLAIHAPALPETDGLVDERALDLLPHGAIVVNTARSSIVDMDALFDRVADGRLDVGLDVFDDEPLPADDRWRGLPNAVITPHIAGATANSRARAGTIVTDEIRRFLTGQPLRHRVTAETMERMA